jgi:hypothetical protein
MVNRAHKRREFRKTLVLTQRLEIQCLGNRRTPQLYGEQRKANAK